MTVLDEPNGNAVERERKQTPPEVDNYKPYF